MLGKKLAIDLGTSTVRLLVRGEEWLLAQPAVVGSRRSGGYAGMGEAAIQAAAASDEVVALSPLAGGEVVDPAALNALLQQVINRAVGRQRIFRPDVVVAVSPGLSDPSRREILEIGARQGARTTYLIDSPLATSLGAGIAPSGRGHMVIDIGAGSVDIATIADEGMVVSASLPGAGDRLRSAVMGRIRERHGVDVEPAVAEDVIASLACVGSHEERRMRLQVRGAKPLTLASTDLVEVVGEHVRSVGEGIAEVLTTSPARLRRDISAQGLILTGGGAGLEGLDRALATALGERVRVAADASLCTVRGAAAAAENLDALKRSFIYIR